MDQPKVTVVIPIYNVEKYLDRCVESIVSQTYENLEIILVDDGSPDRCPQMCDEWAKRDSRITVIHKTNAGLGMARNTGIDNAHGKYVCFFDSDDYVDRTTVEKCVKNAEEYRSDVVIFGRNDVYEDGSIVPKDIAPGRDVYQGDVIRNELLPSMFTYKRGFGISSCGKMYNLDTLKRLDKRFVSERENVSEDAYFAVDLFSDISVATVVCENLYFYFKRNNSLSRIYKPDRQSRNDSFYRKTAELIKDRKLPYDVLSHMTARYQMYSITTLKQIWTSDLSNKEKTKELRRVYKSQTLRGTLHRRIIKLHNRSLGIFFRLLKVKCYRACDLLLRIKVSREK